MGVQHPLRVPGGAGGVAEAAGGVLVEPAPGRVRRTARDQVLVHEHLRPRAVGAMGLVRQDHHPLDAGGLVQMLQQHGHEGQVGEQHPVAGMAGDPHDLVGMQAGVQGVADRPHAHDAVPGLDVPGGVPAKRRHPVAGLDAQFLEGVGDLLGAAVDPAPGGAHDRPFHRAGDHLPVPVPAVRMVQDAIHRHRPVLHQAAHRLPPNGPVLVMPILQALRRLPRPDTRGGGLSPPEPPRTGP